MISSSFKSLDEETKNKLISDKIVDKEVSYHLNNEKYEIIKKYPDNGIIKSLVKENFKNSYFQVSLLPNKTAYSDIEAFDNKLSSNQQQSSIIKKFRNFF